VDGGCPDLVCGPSDDITTTSTSSYYKRPQNSTITKEFVDKTYLQVY
jgi:hypothetical protein